MDFNAIIQAIATVGFPCVMCVVMFVYLQKSNEIHKQEIDRLTETINNNTLVVQELVDRIGG